MLNKKLLLFLCCIWSNAIFSQHIKIPLSKTYSINSRVLVGKNSGYKALSINSIYNDRDFRKLIVHFVVFSDSIGSFNKKEINILHSNEKYMELDTVFANAEINLLEDSRREISIFEYESDYSKFPIRVKSYKVAIQKNDSIYTVYENITHCFFYESRPFKQFTIFQSCASLININSIQQVMPRVIERGSRIVDMPVVVDTPSYYFQISYF